MYERLSDLNPDLPDDYNELLDTAQYDELIARMHSDYAELSSQLPSFYRLRARFYIAAAVVLCKLLIAIKRLRAWADSK